MGFMRSNAVLMAFFISSDCFDYEQHGQASQSHCYSTCLLNRTVTHFKKEPYTEIITRPLRLKHINAYEMADVDFAAELHELEAACGAACSHRDCEQDY